MVNLNYCLELFKVLFGMFLASFMAGLRSCIDSCHGRVMRNQQNLYS